MPGPANIPFGSAANIFCVQVAVAAGAALTASTTVERTYTVTGLLVGDIVIAQKPTFQAGIGIANVRVSAADTLSITFGNFTASTPTLTAENYILTVIRHMYPTTAQIPTAIA